MKVLEVDSINKTFGDFKAINNISFSLDEGKIFGLLGPNGAGKTTTIRMIMNIIIPDSGKISVLNENNMRIAANFIGYLPEERGMYRKMKINELLLFLTKLKQMSKKQANTQIDFWLERVGLSDWKNKKIEELSKGMQQKIQFIGTVLHKPKLLILDEPFGGLDPINANLIKEIMLDLVKDGTTIIFSTHVMESAEKLCEEIFLINKGHKILYGNLAEIKQGYSNQNVLIEYDGDDGFLKNSKQIKKYDNYGNSVEIQLIDNADTQILLKEAMTNAIIKKFEIKVPSLNEIFIETVNAENKEDADHE